VQAASRIGSIAPTFLFASIMFQFVLLVHDVVEEKEGGMRRAMATMGLREGPFWASWILLQGMLFLLEAILLEAFSYAFGFKLVSLLPCLVPTCLPDCCTAYMSACLPACWATLLLPQHAWLYAQIQACSGLQARRPAQR
jgi:hypothetical protein